MQSEKTVQTIKKEKKNSATRKKKKHLQFTKYAHFQSSRRFDAVQSFLLLLFYFIFFNIFSITEYQQLYIFATRPP